MFFWVSSKFKYICTTKQGTDSHRMTAIAGKSLEEIQKDFETSKEKTAQAGAAQAGAGQASAV